MRPGLSRALTGVAVNPSAPLEVLLRLVAHQPAAEAMAWHRRHAMPAALAEKLLATGNRTIAEAFEDTPPPAVARRADDDVDRRCALARVPGLAPEVRDRLLRDPEPAVRVVALMRQDVPDDERRRVLAELEAIPEDSADGWLVGLVLSTAEHDADVLGWVDTLPLPERLRHVDSPVPAIRRAAIGSGGLPPEMSARLDADADPGVRRAAARRPDTPPDVLERLVAEHGDPHHSRPMLVEHPNFPPDGHVRLAAHPDAGRRRLALYGEELPGEVVAALARDTAPAVRAAAAAHPRLTEADAVRLLADEDPEVVEAAGASVVLPITVMTRLLDEAGL